MNKFDEVGFPKTVHPLENFEKFLENEIESLEVNSQFEAMRVKIILTEFRTAQLHHRRKARLYVYAARRQDAQRSGSEQLVWQEPPRTVP